MQISADPSRHVARLPDLDVAVRRIFPLGRFLDVLRSKEMGLVAPHSWEDPREDPVALCMLEGSQLSPPDRKSVVSGTRVSVRVLPGGHRLIKKNIDNQIKTHLDWK